MIYDLREVDGIRSAEVLHHLNAQEPSFPPLEQRHLEQGYWWLAQIAPRIIVGFAGMVPMVPFCNVGYMKRAYVAPAHRGNKLQLRMLAEREQKAREIGWTLLVAEVATSAIQSAGNLVKAGYEPFSPEQPWGVPGAMFFKKEVA